ncbi:MAG: CRISPR-associated protein Cas4 [Anaerolineales bacterium]|nr:CRISPR-associated protein Cas4 [Anaerolineales bacterium]
MDESYLPLSYLNHLIYCPRRFWYMYVQGEIAINAPMLEGTFQHQTRADKPGQETDDRGRTVRRRLWVWSDRLQIAGFTDFVEAEGTALIPVEYKHGQQGKWDNDNIQLCAQALCLEEMTGQSIEQGEIFYWRSRRRITVPFDTELRQLTETAVAQAHELTQTNNIPAPITERKKCRHCSIQPICLPDEVTQLKQGMPTP